MRVLRFIRCAKPSDQTALFELGNPDLLTKLVSLGSSCQQAQSTCLNMAFSHLYRLGVCAQHTLRSE